MSDYDQILPGNPHPGRAERARRLWNLANDGGDDRPDLLHRSQAEATLALAYEQRTATLVQALLSDSLVTDGKYDEIQAEVRKRLGLGEGND